MEKRSKVFQKSQGKMTLFMIVSTVLVTLGVFLIGFTKWALKQFGSLDFEQYLFTIFGPTAGTPVETYIKVAIALGIVVLAIILIMIAIYFFVRYERTTGKPSRMRVRKTIVSFGIVALLVVSVWYTNDRLKIMPYLTKESSGFIEEHYQEPNENTVVFPEKKKNLVFVFLESFEATFYSKELGGNADTNLLPELTQLIEESNAVSFSHNEKQGGLRQTYGTSYSIAGMFAQQSGLPFKVPGDGNQYGVENNFIPGAVALGDLLEDAGYNLQFIAGTNGDFGGVNNFYKTHGNFEVMDHPGAIAAGKIPEDYNVWWGFEDKKLYEYSKEYIDAMAQEDAPFAIVIEATDSHFPDGYTDESCELTSDQPYENSILCSDKMVSEFVRYIQSQPYAEDTLIVVTGDHLSMEQEYFKTLDPNYERTVFNAFFNVDPKIVENAQTKNRNATPIDVFPTIVRGLNADIRAPRLGLGTDLFSQEKTLAEQFGVQHLNDEMSKKSQYFTDYFLLKKTD